MTDPGIGASWLAEVRLTWTIPGARHDEVMSAAPDRLPSDLFVCIDHVGVAVPDLDDAIAFYRRVFGMRVRHQETNEEQGVREAMLGVGETDQCVQLLAPLHEDAAIARFLDRSGPGLQQLAYRVDDVEQVSAVLRERGLRLLYDEPRRGTAGSRINFVHPKDAFGVLIELVEPAS
jgi:methylmalonyl-CoA/ethylmalonyl-CoA epimerase